MSPCPNSLSIGVWRHGDMKDTQIDKLNQCLSYS